MYDVVIIGAGVSGCAAARELSRYKANICVVEKAEDVCCATSKANSGIVHAGYDAPLGSLMAKMNIEGNEKMEALAKELDVPFERNGSLVVCLQEKELPSLQALYEQGIKNGVKGLEILSREDVRKMEPNISRQVVAALYAPTGGIVCPFNLNIALAENANQNGALFRFNTEVTHIEKEESGYCLTTSQGEIRAKYIVNAAGVYADVFHNMVSQKKIHITPRRGDYCLLDKDTGGFVHRTIFQLPNKYGKGALVAPTTHGNTIVGPTAIDIDDKEGTNTTKEGMEQLIEKASCMVHDLPMRQVITSFSGLRAHEDGHEFIIEEVEDAEGFIDCAGIESPGLTSAPAIGKRIADIIKEKMNLEENPHFQATRKGILDPKKLSKQEVVKLIQREPAYGNIICRCERITEGEILDAIRRPLGARSLDGIKRRTRTGMGRCQSGFCMPKTMEILARELHISIQEVTKAGGASQILKGKLKENL